METEIARSASGVACSKEHQRIYAEWFALVDPDGDSRVTGANATSFLAMSGLSRVDLKQVCATADSKRQGYLGFAEFVTTMQGTRSRQSKTSRPEYLGSAVMEGVDRLVARSKAVVRRVHPNDNGTLQVQTPIYHWFSSKSAQKVQMPLTVVTSVIDGLKRLYVEKLKPLEVAYQFNDFASPLLLMRVYGALMWSLGKVLNTPEVARVYIGQLLRSLNDKPVNDKAVDPIGKDLFETEQDDLLCDLEDIPKKACDRRVNEFVKRARAAKIHAYIIGHLKKEMPAMMGKAKARQRLIDNLEEEFAKGQREYHLPAGDFPDVDHFKEVLGGHSIDNFEKLKPKMVQAVDDMLACDIPELLKNFKNPYE